MSVEGQTAFLRALPPGAQLERLLDEAAAAVCEVYWKSVNSLLFLDEDPHADRTTMTAINVPVVTTRCLRMRVTSVLVNMCAAPYIAVGTAVETPISASGPRRRTNGNFTATASSARR